MEAMKDQESPAKKHLISGMKDLTTCNNHENSNCRAKNNLSLERDTMQRNLLVINEGIHQLLAH